MGKQINFYMSKSIQMNFIQYLEQNQFLFLDNKLTEIDQVGSDDVLSMYLYKLNYGEIFMKQENIMSMDCIRSPVIQFNKTIIREEQKKVLRGRLWISNQYYDKNGVYHKKNALLKDYILLNGWIKKNVPYQEIKKGEYYIKEYANDELKELQDKGFILTL